MPNIRPIPSLSHKKLCELEEKANAIRADIMKMLEHAGSGHSAGPLGLADIFSALYFHVLEHDPEKPLLESRDRLLMSCGHNVPVRYAAMAHAGYFEKKELLTLRTLGSRLQGHPEITFLEGLENTSGPLGDGSPQSAGMAFIGKKDSAPWHVYCILSDGELDAGITWEAAMFAAKYRLDNLTWIVDRNNIQIDGNTEDIMPLEPLHEKFASFGFEVLEIDGHNIEEIVDACRMSKSILEKPVVIIAHTIPGRGVDFMEADYRWHGSPPGKGPEDQVEKEQQLKAALKSIRTLNGKITSECE
jgi:transketolase